MWRMVPIFSPFAALTFPSWTESGTHLQLGEQREFSAHQIGEDFDSGIFRRFPACNAIIIHLPPLKIKSGFSELRKLIWARMLAVLGGRFKMGAEHFLLTFQPRWRQVAHIMLKVAFWATFFIVPLNFAIFTAFVRNTETLIYLLKK